MCSGRFSDTKEQIKSFFMKQCLSAIHFNAWSLRKHYDEIYNFLASLDHTFSLICISETWLSQADNLFGFPSYAIVLTRVTEIVLFLYLLMYITSADTTYHFQCRIVKLCGLNLRMWTRQLSVVCTTHLHLQYLLFAMTWILYLVTCRQKGKMLCFSETLTLTF